MNEAEVFQYNEEKDGFLRAVFADPIGRWIILALIIVFGIVFMYFAGARAWKALAARIEKITGQLENDHVKDPGKTSNLRDDLDQKFNALHGRLDIMGRVTAANTQSISTVVAELAAMNGKEVVTEHTVQGTEILKIKGENYG